MRNPLDRFVVLVLIAAISAVAALLPFAVVHRRLTYGLCVLVFILALIGICGHLRSVYRSDKTRTLLSRLLADGQEMADTFRVANWPPDGNARITEWNNRTRTALTQYLDESYVRRFDSGTGTSGENRDSLSTNKLSERVTLLRDFLKEIRD